MIIDSFMFLNEFDLLEGRLEYLNDVVDYFIIVENDTTHSGNKKPLNFHDNAARYEKYHHKIIYLPMSYKNDHPDHTIATWDMEHYQRNYISTVCDKFSDDDIILIGDLDEIPNKSMLKIMIQDVKDGRPYVGTTLDMFYCNLKFKQVTEWHGLVVTSIALAKQNGIQWFRSNRGNIDVARNAGWHLTYWNTIENIKYKIENFAHQEVNKPEFTDLKRIAERIKNGTDLFDRAGIQMIPFDTSTLPRDFADIFLKYTPNQEYNP